ncbi:unnamed protein product [Cyprideis torosa]|uniref:Uncharacterized protein n=1 Tax=Cyprideis torosa TaxID=163714 RepID=A0A7R8W0R7_9CRUS|nr:unnamed protein product [Cyprideis torosa]CAG0880049.1 unnamed protein product [Cyprideis torosa]
MLSFFMSTIYESTLISFLSSPPQFATINSANDLEASGRHWITLPNTVMTKAFENKPVLDSRLITASSEKLQEYAVRMLEEPGKYVIVQAAPPPFMWITWIKGEDNIRKMEYLRKKYRWKQIWPFYISPVVLPLSGHITFQKKSPLLPKLDPTIAHLIECGIKDALEGFEMIKWNLQYFSRQEAQNRRTELKKPVLAPLEFDQLAGAYAILVIGMVLGTFVFICELLVHKYWK